MNITPFPGEVNDPLVAEEEEEDSLSRKLFERTESLLGRFHHTSSKKATTETRRETSPESILGRMHCKQKEKPFKKQKTEPSPKMQGLTNPPAKIQGMPSSPKMQEMKSPRLKREGSKRKTKVAENDHNQIFTLVGC